MERELELNLKALQGFFSCSMSVTYDGAVLV